MARTISADDTLSLDRLAGLLRRATRRVDAALRSALEALEVGPREYGVLALLAEHGALSQQAAAALLSIDRTSMVGVIDSLERLELVTRKRDTNDRRAHSLVITSAGEKRRRQGARALQQAEVKLLGEVNEKEHRRLARALAVLGADEAATDE